MMKRVMCIWLPQWPIQRVGCELRRKSDDQANATSSLPSPLGRGAGGEENGRQNDIHSQRKKVHDSLPPIVLYSDCGQRGLRVMFACPQAARHGVRPGMSLAEAKGLMQDAERPLSRGERGERSEACFLEHDSTADLAALKKLAAWCGRFSPFVGVEGSDSLLIDLTGCAHLFGGERPLCRRINQTFRNWGLSIRLAIADTVGAAWGCARYRTRTPSPPQSTHDSSGKVECGSEGLKIASTPRPSPPLDTLIIVPPRQQAEALRPLPIRALRLADNVVQTLKDLGVDRIEQLLALPRESLPGRLGTQILQQWDRATGETDELIAPVRPCEPIILCEDFEHSTHDRGQLTRVLQSLIERLMRQLAEQNAGLQRLDVKFVLDNHTDQQVSLGMLRPAASAAHVMDLLCLRLERLKLDANVIGLRLHAVTIGLLETHQGQLFECEDDFQSRRELARLVDRLNSRLGEGRVVHPRLHDDAQPELAMRWESAGASSATSQSTIVRYRPLRLYAKPLPIEVMSIVPEGPPIRFRWERELHTVARYWGPERIETGWWREHFISRDYYRVETETGRRYWLFRRRGDESWYMQGEFG